MSWTVNESLKPKSTGDISRKRAMRLEMWQTALDGARVGAGLVKYYPHKLETLLQFEMAILFTFPRSRTYGFCARKHQ